MLNNLTLSEAVKGLKEKKFSRSELLKDTLKRIKEIDGKICSLRTINEQIGNEAGKNSLDLENSPLLGIPMAVKEVLSINNLRTTASSKILDKYNPIFDATVVKRLKKAGAVVIGKTNCDAFAFGASTENSGYGPTKNPWDLERVPGGSSGGSAAAVAADECIFALGTDTGGSIRQPASFCNIVGLKPTYGACSRYGLLAMASSFDCPGPMAKTVEDCEIIFDLMKGEDENDATSLKKNKSEEKIKKDKLIIGLPKEFFSEGIDEEVKKIVMEAAKLLGKEGYSLKEVNLPHSEYAIAVYYILVPSEISSNMGRYDGIRFGGKRDLFEEEVKRRIMIGTFTLSAGYFDQYYLKAAKVRSLIQNDYLEAFKKVDLLLAPVAPTPPFKIGENTNDPLKMYLEDILTVGVNLSGNPALALPAGFTQRGLPVGMQLIGPHFSEEMLLGTGKYYQTITDWHKKKPAI